MFRYLLSRKLFSVGLIIFCLVAIGVTTYFIIDPETENVEEASTPANRPPTMKERQEQRRLRRKQMPHDQWEKIQLQAWKWTRLPQDEFDEKVYQLLVGDMLPDEAIDYLETYHIYTPVILDRVDMYRAFEYLRNFDPGGTSPEEHSKIYAARILEAEPEHLEAQLYLAQKEPDDGKREAMYRKVLESYPNSTDALVGLGKRLWKDRPVEAVEVGKKAARLGDPRGHLILGYAYQRLGDYDTALTQMKKAHALSPGRDSAFHINVLEEGKPVFQPLASETPSDETDVFNGSLQKGRVSGQKAPQPAPNERGR